jgi:hypothetical protein
MGLSWLRLSATLFLPLSLLGCGSSVPPAPPVQKCAAPATPTKVGISPIIYVRTTNGPPLGFRIMGNGALTPISSFDVFFFGSGMAFDSPFLYILDFSVFETSVNFQTGALTLVGSTSLGQPETDHVAACHKVVYTSTDLPPYRDAGVSAFTFDASGNASTLPGSPFHAGTFHPGALLVDSSCRFLFVADGTVFGISSTGVLTQVAGSPFSALQGIGFQGTGQTQAIDPSSRFLYVIDNASEFGKPVAGDVRAFAIGSNGTPMPVPGAALATGLNPTAATAVVVPSGSFLYVANTASNDISGFAVDSCTGALTPVPGQNAQAGNQPVAVASFGNFLYVANQNSQDISAYTVDTDGTLRPIAGSPFSVGASPASEIVVTKP